MSKSKRIDFIPELRAALARQLRLQGLQQPEIDAAFLRWDDNCQPLTPVEHGCFEIFRQVQRDIEANS